ncbi:acyl-CoA dehydrogenase family protein [Streptomyces sp. NPDC057889]|uniref:acyl-CoA dehydrogenase family protein n=1 Tax=unclassified Streptomyces TaxID=2593676 RepID=UPI003684CEC6
MTAVEQEPSPSPGAARDRLPSVSAGLFRGRLLYDALEPPGKQLPASTAEEDAFLSRLRKFCAAEVDGQQIERDDRIPDAVIEGLADIGALAIRLPRRYGGLGLSHMCYLRSLMIVSTAHASLGELLAAHQAIGVQQPLLLYGTAEQCDRFLPRCRREISGFALTEADIGNDPFRMRTTAVLDETGENYTLDGVKLWTTNGVIADLLMVMAMVPASDGTGGGMTAFVVETASAGVTIEHRSTFLGLRGLENGVVRLHQVRVPVSQRVGREGEGLDVALAAQDTSRLSVPAVCAAAAKWSVKVAREWSRSRIQWGRPIGEHDAVAGKLSFIAATAFALEAVVEMTGHRVGDGISDCQLDGELAKLFAAEKTWQIADELVQVRGGRGYETVESAVARGERGVPAEQLLRDVRIGRIFDGSSEVLRSFVAESVAAGMLASGGNDDGALADAFPSAQYGILGRHLRFVAHASRRLAGLGAVLAQRSGSGLVSHQRAWGRIVDAASELYAMSATCAYARCLAEQASSAEQLADVFCAQAQDRVEQLLARVTVNTDESDRALARDLLSGRHAWLEEGVVDPSTDGPWIAIPEAGPSRSPDVRRRLRSSNAPRVQPAAYREGGTQ